MESCAHVYTQCTDVYVSVSGEDFGGLHACLCAACQDACVPVIVIVYGGLWDPYWGTPRPAGEGM